MPVPDTQYKTVRFQWFVKFWFSLKLFPTMDKNEARKLNRFTL